MEGLKTPYIIDFYADWCGPCKVLGPILEKREANSGGKWTLIKVNVDNGELEELVTEHQVAGIPMLAYYKGGQKVFETVGSTSDAGLKKLEEEHLL